MAGDCQRGWAEVCEGSDGSGKDHGKQPVGAPAQAILDHDDDDDDDYDCQHIPAMSWL